MNKILLILSFVATVGAVAQKTPTEIKGDNFFRLYSYANAIDKYSQVDGLSLDGQRNLAESYSKTGDNYNSEKTYLQFINGNETTSEDLFNYASALRLNKKYAESDKWMKKFKSAAPKDLRAVDFVSHASDLTKLLKDEGRFTIQNLDVNTKQQDFGTSYYGNDKVVFASSREGVKPVKRLYNWNKLPYLDMYVADATDIQLSNPSQLYKKVNKKLHEGPASFSNDGNKMSFTRDNYEEKSVDGTTNLSIFFLDKNKDGEWENEEAFPLNNKEYSVGHPHLSKNGNVMYFASDMPGGIGGVDIYRIFKNEDGTWGKAENLGDHVNTEGNEMFPFFHEEKKMLFFASNGHFGLGGLDIFVSQNDNGNFTKIHNVGTPVNSAFDDFAVIMNDNMKSGYFTSNRDGGKGDDDIYSFKMLRPFTFGKIIKGIARDKQGEPVAGAVVNLYNSEGKVIQSKTVSKNGTYEFMVPANKKFSLKGEKDKYFDGNNVANTKTSNDIILANLTLEKDPGLSLYALITDSKTGKSLSGVVMTITDNMNGKRVKHTTPKSGDYRRALADKKLSDRGSYNFTLQKEGYFTKMVTYNTKFEKPGQYDVHAKLDLSLDPEVKDLSEMIQINPINFDLNKYNIRPDASIELDKIVVVMNKYKHMVIELGAHTDCRASKAYNEKLSDKRAKASAKYIKSKISSPERIYGKGYGESLLLNDCECEGKVKSDCDEERHSQNRRTEFKVISTGNDKVKVNNTSTDSFGK